MRKILKNVLRAFRCKKITEANDGAAALNAIHSSGRVDIVFTDWTMPDCNGIELIEKIH